MDAKVSGCVAYGACHIQFAGASFMDTTPQQSCHWWGQERDVLTEEKAWLRKVKKYEEVCCDRDDLIWFLCTTELNKRRNSFVHKVQEGKEAWPN